MNFSSGNLVLDGSSISDSDSLVMNSSSGSLALDVSSVMDAGI